MRKIKFGILIILMVIGGVALFQVENVCAAHENVLTDCEICIPANSYSKIFTIPYQTPFMETISYKISIRTDDYPLNLLILDQQNYNTYTHGTGSYKCRGQTNIISGSYTLHFSGSYFTHHPMSEYGPLYVLLENPSEDPVNVHAKITHSVEYK
jgi:hypothetical protein